VTVRTFVVIVSLIAAYFASTWFYFGSSHPCEILVARQKDHHIDLAEKHHQEDLESWREMARKALPPKDYERFVRNIQEYSSATGREENLQRSIVKDLRQKLSEMTPAQCAWQAMAWQAPPLAP
jgi:hypothetical protein